MKAYGGVDVQIHILLTSALVGVVWSVSRPCRFIRRERIPGTHLIWDWVGPRAGLDAVERRKFLTLPGLELRPLCRSARSQSLYRLCYPGSLGSHIAYLNIIYKTPMPKGRKDLNRSAKEPMAEGN
jgi:hypothetical protein